MGNTNGSEINRLVAKEGGFSGVNQAVVPIGGNLNAYDEHGLTNLHRAILADSVNDVKQLIASGADPNLKTKSGWSCFHLVAKTGNLEILAILLGKASDVNIDDLSTSTTELEERTKKIVFVGKSTALHVAAQMGHQRVAQVLTSMGQGAEKVRNDKGMTPEEVAKANSNSAVLEILQNDVRELRKDFEKHKKEMEDRLKALEEKVDAIQARQKASRDVHRRLTKPEQDKIRQNFSKLCKMNVKQIICYLFLRQELTFEEMQSLRSLQGAEELQKKFIIIHKLMEGQVKDVQSFRKILDESGQNKLLDALPNV